MPKGVYERKPRGQAQSMAVTVLPKPRGPQKNVAQAYQMLRAASAQLHALALQMDLASQLLAGSHKDHD